MTGNTVLLGIALVDGSPARVARSGCAVAGFCIGAAFAARLIHERTRTLWPARVTYALAGEATALVALGIGAALTSPTGVHVYWMIVLSGVAMGTQSASVQAVAIPGIATTYITGTVTGFVAGLATRGRWRPSSPAQHSTLRLAAFVWGTYLLAALAGAGAAHVVKAQAIWIAAATILTVVAVAFRNRHELPGAGKS